MNSNKCNILFNLGGVRSIKDIMPFLFNMFNDKHIININQPFRCFLACAFTFLRVPKTYLIYKNAGESPLFSISKKQAHRLTKKTGIKTYSIYAYSTPKKIKCKNYTTIPLYPFYSHAIYGIAFDKLKNIQAPLCIYADYINIITKKIKETLKNFDNAAIVLSAHNLPKKLSKKTHDPYEHDLYVFKTLLAKVLRKHIFLSYQSQLGPVEWLTPTTEEIMHNLIKKYDKIIIVPISFIAENTETTYEIDILYKRLAKKIGFKNFARVKCPNDDEDFIKLLGGISKP